MVISWTDLLAFGALEKLAARVLNPDRNFPELGIRMNINNCDPPRWSKSKKKLIEINITHGCDIDLKKPDHASAALYA